MRKTDELVHSSQNGDLELEIVGDQRYGLPFGSTPRLFLAFLVTEAKRRNDPFIPLGKTMSEFMRQCGISAKGSRQSKDFMRHCERVANSKIRIIRKGTEGQVGTIEMYLLISRITFERGGDMNGVLLTDWFFGAIQKHSTPINLKAMIELKDSPLAIDLLHWAVWRNFTCGQAGVHVPWPLVSAQFGLRYARERDMREALKTAASRVGLFCPGLRISAQKSGIHLHKSPHAILSAGL